MSTSKHSGLQRFYTKSGLVRFQVQIEHPGLGKVQTIKGDDAYVVKQKAATTMAKWDEMWATRQEKERRANEIQMGHETANERTQEAQHTLEVLEGVLAHTLAVNDAVDWANLKSVGEFAVPRPSMPGVPSEPKPDEPKFHPKLGLLDYLLTSKRKEKEANARKLFESDHAKWAEAKAQAELVFERNVSKWEKEKAAFYRQRDELNAAIEKQKQDYLTGADSQAIVDYCELVLNNSEYPHFFPQSFELGYDANRLMLVIDYQLPSPDEIPTLTEVKFVQSRNTFTEKNLTQAQHNRLYDNVLYQIALRTLHEIFESDQINAIVSVVFNGYVDSVDPATGNRVNACVLSVQASKEEFVAINLALVDPKACFKKLKGVGSSKLHSIVPVAPLIQLEKEDSRFVDAYEVASALDEGDNLATMDWEDFEHLVRELFEKEFAHSGGEVKVTQASRDGGVDAVVFDPDPIRGGKIVIQAKRYANTVGVSAVRDLYGTVMNEGANKGILVTTSDYGPDAYRFASDKPLTLLNGGNLLHLLEKHGHRARIDLKEAKQTNRGNQR